MRSHGPRSLFLFFFSFIFYFPCVTAMTWYDTTIHRRLDKYRTYPSGYRYWKLIYSVLRGLDGGGRHKPYVSLHLREPNFFGKKVEISGISIQSCFHHLPLTWPRSYLFTAKLSGRRSHDSNLCFVFPYKRSRPPTGEGNSRVHQHLRHTVTSHHMHTAPKSKCYKR